MFDTEDRSREFHGEVRRGRTSQASIMKGRNRMNIQRFAAFSEGNSGGNPAGVVIGPQLPEAEVMQRIAHEVGFSETVFSVPKDGAWDTRYFSPESEVPFCGHATIALGAALSEQQGPGEFQLDLSGGSITVEGGSIKEASEESLTSAALQSPPTRSEPAEEALVDEVLELFSYDRADLSPSLPPAWAHAGADHLVLALDSEDALAAMSYNLAAGKDVMNRAGLTTIAFIYIRTPQEFEVRNAFASGGVVEDPATGAAAAALAGYLRDMDWPHGGQIEIRQGRHMGVPSRIHARFSSEPGSSIRVSGTVRRMS